MVAVGKHLRSVEGFHALGLGEYEEDIEVI